MQQKLNTGIIFTNSNCIGCNKCISGCISMGANVVVKEDNSERYTVAVDPNKCILCGICVAACVHHARSYLDDTEDFFKSLENGEDISILVSPTLLTDYENQYHNILGYLKHLGVKHIFNTSYGGDIMVWSHMNLIHSFGLAGVISQFCPVIVNYIEKFKPELLDCLMPVQSPVICTAIYVSDYLKITDKLAYISPCIAGKHEIHDVNTYGKVSYNVTFERLMKRLENIDISGFYADDESSYGLGVLISMPGGLSENIKRYIGFNEVLIQTTGPSNIFPYFNHYYKEVLANEKLPLMVDALSCTNGCNFGTGTSCGVELRNEMTFSTHRVRENAYHSGNVCTDLDQKVRLKKLNKCFENFELSSFVRQYGQTRKVKPLHLTEEEIDHIYNEMYKDTAEKRHTDCGSCGYITCHDMAYAIGTNVNHKENCINYSKECIRIETEKTKHLLDEISNMNEELKTTTQLKSNFLANMSHEIRTPMNAIIGMAEIALRGNLPLEERSYIEQIKSSGRSLLAIINDILDFSKIESGKMELIKTDYKVMSIINDTANIVMTRIADKDISLIIDVDPTIPNTLHGDDIRIKQVLVNLSNNAVKFTESGYVKISLSHERYENGIFLTVSVKDTGIGIKEEDLKKLFTSFQQVDSKRNRNVEGTGLGLAISREFIKLMKGKISVNSTYETGSTFSFTIPQQIVHDTPCAALKHTDTVKTASLIRSHYVKEGYLSAISKFPNIENTQCTCIEDLESAQYEGTMYFFIDSLMWNQEIDAFAKKYSDIKIAVIVDPRKDILTAPYVHKLNQPIYCLNIVAFINHETIKVYDHNEQIKDFLFEAPEAKILIVDDNAINLTVAKGLLSPLHMKISVASSALDAIRLLENDKFDIVFMDHMMPDIDGIDATHMIREKKEPYYKNLPIIALTANAINNARDVFIQEGMNDFVAKPIDMVDITAKLKKWLPQEKIVYTGTINVAQKSNNKLPKIDGLDVKAGIALSGTKEIYLSVLSDYYDVIEKKANLIETYLEERNIEAYTIEVHSLKSASKLIGANSLSEMAAKLEKYGHEKNLTPILSGTKELLECYRSYIPILEPYGRKSEYKEDAKIEPALLKEMLCSLNETLEDFDIDTAIAIINKLKSFHLDDKSYCIRENLCHAVTDMEYDDAIAITTEWMDIIM